MRTVYATHNDSPAVRQALAGCIERLPDEWRGLNVGSGNTRVHSRIVNLDLQPGPEIDVCGTVEHLPFDDASFDFVMSQEVIEHVREPFRAVAEMRRVMKPGGLLYCQTPFVIGFHPEPSDYWRFTVEGIQALVEQAGLEVSEVGIAVGAGTGFYRIAVEFGATLVSAMSERAYIPIKGLLALGLFPLKYADRLANASPQRHRIPGGYYVVARRA